MTQFLKDFDFQVKTDKRVTYHDPCDLGRHAGIYDEPREIIRKIAPNFVRAPAYQGECDVLRLRRRVSRRLPEDSIAISKNRLAQMVEETGAEILLTECPPAFTISEMPSEN